MRGWRFRMQGNCQITRSRVRFKALGFGLWALGLASGKCEQGGRVQKKNVLGSNTAMGFGSDLFFIGLNSL